MLNEVDLNKNGQVELDEFLQVSSTLVTPVYVTTNMICRFDSLWAACVKAGLQETD